MLLIELFCKLWSIEFAHFKFGDGETAAVDVIDDLTRFGVTVRFDHGEGLLGLRFELSSSEKITIFNKFKLSCIYIDN